MSDTNHQTGIDASGLRERLPQQPDAPIKAIDVDTAQDAVKKLNEDQQRDGKDEKEKKTYGRTPDGTGEYSAYDHPAGLFQHMLYLSQTTASIVYST